MKKLIGLLLILSMSLNILLGVKSNATLKANLCGLYSNSKNKFIKSGVLIDQLHQFAQKALEDKKLTDKQKNMFTGLKYATTNSANAKTTSESLIASLLDGVAGPKILGTCETLVDNLCGAVKVKGKTICDCGKDLASLYKKIPGILENIACPANLIKFMESLPTVQGIDLGSSVKKLTSNSTLKNTLITLLANKLSEINKVKAVKDGKKWTFKPVLGTKLFDPEVVDPDTCKATIVDDDEWEALAKEYEMSVEDVKAMLE